LGTLGWVLLAAAFLVFMMVANNSWSWVWAKIRTGLVPGTKEATGEGNLIVPVPPPSEHPDHINVPEGTPNITGPAPGTIVPVPPESSTPFQITPDILATPASGIPGTFTQSGLPEGRTVP